MKEIILLAHGMQMFIEMEMEFLQYSPVEILTAKDGYEALKVIRNKQPNLIVMDIYMPKMDGINCCWAIKSDYLLSNIPVVMVTARGNEAEQKKAYLAGCDHIITKPLERDNFITIARSFVPSVNRRGNRVQICLDAVCRINNESISCTIYELGVEGAFIASTYHATHNSVIHITFTLPGGTIIECQGRIVWLNRFSAGKPVGFGVHFEMLTNRAKMALTMLIDHS